MKKYGIVLILAFVASSVFGQTATTTPAEKPMKIGYVDIEAVFEKYPNVDVIKKKLLDEKNQYEQEIQRLKSEIARLEEDFQNNFNRLTEDERQRRTVEINYKKEALSEYIEDANNKLDGLKDKLTTPVYAKIVAVIRKIGTEKGYNFIFRKSSSFILYEDKTYDLTVEVINRLKSEIRIEER